MGFTICRNLHINTTVWVGRNSERDRISTKKRLKNASEPPIQAEIAPPPIPNSIFFWRKGGSPDSPPRMALVKRSPVSPVFRVPPFKPWLRHCSQTSQLDLRGHFCLPRDGGERRETRKGRGEKRNEKI